MRPKGLYLFISDELNAEFRTAIEKKLGRPTRRGDILNAGEAALRDWITSV